MNWLTAREVAERYGVPVTRVRKQLERRAFGDRQIRAGKGKTQPWLIDQNAAEEKFKHGKKKTD